MLPVSISSSDSDKSSVELLPPTLLITSSLSSDPSINCFFKTFFFDLDFYFFLFVFICFFLLQFLQHRLLRNNLNKKLHHCIVTNHRANIINRSHRLHICMHVYIYYMYIYTVTLSPGHFTFLISDGGKDLVFQYRKSKMP